MTTTSPSTKIYAGLVIALSLLSAVNVFLPQGDFLPSYQLPASKIIVALATAAMMFVVYGGLGFIGLMLARKLGFAEIWDERISNQHRFLTPMLIGLALGLFFILLDAVLSRFHSLGPLPHPPFPTSLVASVIAGIGEEIMFRLFYISFWLWLISFIILKKRWRNQIFWVVAFLSAAAFAAAHFPSVMILYDVKSIGDLPVALLSEILLLNGVLSLFCAWHLRKNGFLAAVGIHFWADVVWHVLRGML